MINEELPEKPTLHGLFKWLTEGEGKKLAEYLNESRLTRLMEIEAETLKQLNSLQTTPEESVENLKKLIAKLNENRNN